MNPPELAVCILFYNKAEQTIECIESFLASGVKIYVLNNNSEVASREKLGLFCAEKPQVVLFDSVENLGVGRGRNYLIGHTQEQWLLFVDNDITIKTADWVKLIQKHIAANPQTEVFVPQMFNVHTNAYAKHLQVAINGQIAEFTWVDSSQSLTNMFPGGASFCSRELFERLGDYDAGMFVGFEDFEMGIRGVKMQSVIRAQVIDDIELVHDHRQLVSKADIEATRVRYDFDKIAASELRIKEKHGVTLDNDWRPWVKEQIAILNKNDKHSALKALLSKFVSSGQHKLKMLWLRQK